MKHKNVEVGQHAIIKRSTSAVWATAALHIGEEFTVAAVEPLGYTGEGTVLVKNHDSSVTFWCNHRDLKLIKEEAPAERALELYVGESAPAQPEIGALFVVTGNTDGVHCFPVGTVVRCAEPPPHRDGGCCRYEDKGGTRQFVSLSDLKPLSLADIQAALDNQETPEQEELPWPWPKGTPVALTDEGREYVKGHMGCKGIPPDTPLFLGSDGSDIPPLETADGQYICYVDDTYVTRK